METISDGATANLSVPACWELLRTATLARLAIIVDNHPEIFPLNFVVDHGTVVFRSGPGAKLSALGDGTATALEADGLSTEDSTMWSVMICGYLEPVVGFDLTTTEALALYPLEAGPKPRFIRVVPESITGRRFHPVDPSTWRANPGPGRAQAWE